jgi:hypothetical protein
MGACGFDELFLQFKTPVLLLGDARSFATTNHQHRRLKCYPQDTAYYVTHLFRDVPQIQHAQRTAANPEDFLRWYLAIEISRLELDVRRFRCYASGSAVDTLLYKRDVDGPRRTPIHRVNCGRDWMPGDELLRQFRQGTIGARVCLITQDQPEAIASRFLEDRDTPLFDINPASAEQMAGNEVGTDWGIALRKNCIPLPFQLLEATPKSRSITSR